MKWYIQNTETGDLIGGPYDNRTAAYDQWQSNLKDDEWLADHDVDLQNDTLDKDWWLSGWKPVPEWAASPVTNPKHNPDTDWHVHNNLYEFSIDVEQHDNAYYVAIMDQSEYPAPLVHGTQCKTLGDVFEQIIEYATNHEQYHDNDRKTLQEPPAHPDVDEDATPDPYQVHS